MKRISIKRIIALSMTVAVSLCSFAGFSADSSTTTESRTYRRRIYSGENMGVYEYTLTQTLDNNATSRSVDGVNGTDDRVPDSNSSIVQVYVHRTKTYSSGWYAATGFIVDDHTIATAAHMIYDTDENRYIGDAYIKVYNEETDFYMQFDVMEYHIPMLYVTTEEQDYDYALLTVSEDLSEYGIFSLGVLSEEADEDDNIPITVSGFPGELEDSTGNAVDNDPKQLYTGTGNLIETYPRIFCYDTDTSPGNSGGPVYIKKYYTTGNTTVYTNTVVGICSGHDPNLLNDLEWKNTACRITSPILQFYLNNPNIGY